MVTPRQGLCIYYMTVPLTDRFMGDPFMSGTLTVPTSFIYLSSHEALHGFAGGRRWTMVVTDGKSTRSKMPGFDPY